jgi:diadenosine tetraphosphate (Ap4A) HIT family hydrolase
MLDCPFCHAVSTGDYLLRSEEWMLRFDKYPVSQGHMLLIPIRHVRTVDQLDPTQWEGLYDILRRAIAVVGEEFHTTSYNLGVNAGAVAGQTIEHLHLHVIPRYPGDVPDPTGGVRGVIPGKQKYQRS